MISYYDKVNKLNYDFVSPTIAEVSDFDTDFEEIIPGTTKVMSIDIKEFFKFQPNTELRFGCRYMGNHIVRAWADYPKYTGNSVVVTYDSTEWDGTLLNEFLNYGISAKAGREGNTLEGSFQSIFID